MVEFPGLTEEAKEHAMEEAMTLRLSQTLAEFGAGFNSKPITWGQLN